MKIMITISLDADLEKRLSDLSLERDVSKSGLVERALDRFFLDEEQRDSDARAIREQD